MTLVWISGWAYAPEAWGNVLGAALPGVDVRILDPIDVLADPNRLRFELSQAPNPILGGWSLGAMLALEAAAAFAGSTPLLLVSGTPSFCRRPGFEHGMEPAHVRALRAGLRRDRDGALQSFYQMVEGSAPHPTPRTLRSSEDLMTGLDYLLRTDLRPLLPALQTRACLLHGARDGLIPFEAGRDLQARLEGSAFVLADEAGHDIPFTHPSLVRDCMDQLLLSRR